MSISQPYKVEAVVQTPWVHLVQEFLADGSMVTYEETWNGEHGSPPLRTRLFHQIKVWTPRKGRKIPPKKEWEP